MPSFQQAFTTASNFANQVPFVPEFAAMNRMFPNFTRDWQASPNFPNQIQSAINFPMQIQGAANSSNQFQGFPNFPYQFQGFRIFQIKFKVFRIFQIKFKVFRMFIILRLNCQALEISLVLILIRQLCQQPRVNCFPCQKVFQRMSKIIILSNFGCHRQIRIRAVIPNDFQTLTRVQSS